MKTLFAFVITVLCAGLVEARTRYDVTNDLTGNQFSYQTDSPTLDYWEPAWGLHAREIPCAEVPSEELTRITKRETRETEPAVYEVVESGEITIPPPDEKTVEEKAPKASGRVVAKPAVTVEFCTLKDQFTIVTKDVRAERAADLAKKLDLEKLVFEVRPLKGKKTFTEAEKNKILSLLLEQL